MSFLKAHFFLFINYFQILTLKTVYLKKGGKKTESMVKSVEKGRIL